MTAFATASVTAPLQLFDFHPVLADFRSAVLQGLSQTPKRIPATWLYDQRGAELFDQITALEEYYLTRTEMQILQERAVEIGDRITQGALVEFGSGSSQKIRILFDALRAKGKALPVYVGLDISKQHLQQSCEDLQRDYPELAAIAICADYTQPLRLPDVPVLQNRHKTAFFPGSTLGNLEPEDAIAFLKTVAHLIGPGGDLLIGIDLQKSKSILEPAYDDAQGISAQFALNVLTRMNRELGANFDLAQFRYEAVYNEALGRIEMYIVSQIAQTVEVAGEAIAFAAGERLYTEHSYKYTPAQFNQLAAQAGFRTRSVWTDSQALFMVVDLATCP
ncbi:MAG: L-histidine N(alpha)-methyltransferase [Synechococcales cyanobacterium CRU_2_2]|nr:L-histidine N(alpha)-methyltransferase [Synechococcales cyanobacterium CRU_2_2]